MIEPIEGKGVNRARVTCDECSRQEAVTCKYERAANAKWVPDKGQVIRKITAHGWADIKGRLLCPTCDAKRKVVSMSDKKAQQAAASEPREPTRAQMREIVDMLKEVYDTSAERYRQGDTDETVADVLGVMPGWVTRLREEFFGPAGGNEDMAALAADLDAFVEAATKRLTECTEVVDRLKADIAQAQTLRKRLGGIEAAVGPRRMARVK